MFPQNNSGAATDADAQTLEVTTGWQNMSSSSAKVEVKFMRPGKRQTESLSSLLTPTRPVLTIPADTEGTYRYGSYHTQRYRQVEGALITLQYTSSMLGRSVNQARMLVMLRDSGPLLLVRCRLPSHRFASLGTVTAFLGRGDIMSPGEAEELGYVIDDRVLSLYFDPDNVNAAFDIEEIAPAKAEKPQIVHTRSGSDDGTPKAVLIASQKKRRLRIRK